MKMFKNQNALKLSLYFGIVLLVLSIIIGSIFMFLFRRHTINIHKDELRSRAESIAETLSTYMLNNSRMGGFGAYVRFINDIAGADAWIVDENLNLITTGNGMGHMYEHSFTYADLPKDAEMIIQEVFLDKIVFSEDFSGVMSESTLTVGVPIKNNVNNVIGVVLLHSPIRGTEEALRSSMGILVLSILVGFGLSFLLSLWLSKHFTDPITLKEAEDALKMENIRRDFVANISHELKTPITVMRGSLEALTDKIVTDPEMVESYHKQMLVEAIYFQCARFKTTAFRRLALA